MGKGDKRTRKGKISVGSYGKSRPKKKKTTAPAVEEKPKTKSKKKAE
ncbi:MAG: 30S ribosomal protein THX [Acidobacteriota bacterium]